MTHKLLMAKATAAGVFDPPTLVSGVTLWLDPTDAASFTFSSGSVVSQWNDKSGNARHVTQGTTSKQPGRTGVENGLTTVVFDGTDDVLIRSTAEAWSHATDGAWTSWAVYVPSSTSGTKSVVDADDTDAAVRLAQLIRVQGSTSQSIAFADPVAAYTDSAGTTLSTSTCYILVAVRRASEVEMYVNGVTNGATATSGTNAKMNVRLCVGARAAAGGVGDSFAAGEIGDVIHINDNQSAADINTLGNALATRWGVSWTTVT